MIIGLRKRKSCISEYISLRGLPEIVGYLLIY